MVSEYKHNVPDGAEILLEIPSRTSIRDKTGNVIETTEVLFTLNKNVLHNYNNNSIDYIHNIVSKVS